MKSDLWIKSQEGMIEPFIDHTVREIDGHKACSFGLSCAGYDMRLDDKVFYRVFPDMSDTVDPKTGKTETMTLEVHTNEFGKYVDVPPGVYYGSTIEYVKMPRNVAGFFLLKSTYARCGLSIVAPLVEPAYEGQLSVTFVNSGMNNVRVYLGEGFCQLVFFDVGEVGIDYSQRGGLYGGKGVQFSKVSE